MALVNRNAGQLARIAAPLAAAGLRKAVDNRQAIWDGVKWVWASLPKRKKKNNISNGGTIAHPQGFPGAVAAPVAYAYKVKGRKPAFRRSKGSVTITHREYVSEIDGTTGVFSRNNGTDARSDFALNPLNPLVFPWLTSIAANFDQYIFKSVKLEYIPLATTATPGRVALFYDKDSEDPGPTDRSGLANYQHLSEISPWGMTTLSIPGDNVKRFMADNSTIDPKLINLGKIGWVTYGTPTQELGDLFIEYTVELYEAQPTAITMESIFRDATTGAATIFGPAYTSLETVSTTSATFLFRAPGTYLVQFIANPSTAAFNTPTLSNGGVVNSDFGVGSAGRFSYMANITVVRNSLLSFTGFVGLANFQMFISRTTVDLPVSVH